ncbi:MAG: hypothetical protein IJ660_01900 [Alphaproteobacteria bacterium]|nr:hypothetical protein [Alphaproteobacteria bacterium]
MTKALEKKFATLDKYIPEELKEAALNKNLENYKNILIPMNISHLPFNFKLNTRGGWISPDGTWYVESLSADPDVVLRPKLKDSAKYNHNLRIQAFKEGWVRLDWQQAISSRKFEIKESSSRKFIITLDGNTKINYKLFLAIQTIAMVYTLVQATKFTYELRLVTKYEDKKITHKAEQSQGFEFFNIQLNKIRR